MSSRLDYVTMSENKGHFRMATGEITVDANRLFSGMPQPIGRGLRVYRKATAQSGDVPAHLWMEHVGQIVTMLSQQQARDVLCQVASSGTQGRRQRRRQFATIELKTNKVRPLSDLASADVGSVVRRWIRRASRDDLLVELDASCECLAELSRECGASARALQRAATRRRVERRGSERTALGLPSETESSAALRAALSKDWLDAAAVNRLLGSKAGNVSHLPSKLRREGRILGVWVVPAHGYRFPAWQFRHGRPIEEFREILELLRGPRGVAPGRQTSGWEEIEWLQSPNAWLKGRCPSEVLASDPMLVLQVARRAFVEDADARW